MAMKFNPDARQRLRPVDDIFGKQSFADSIQQLPVVQLHNFTNHPFSVRDDEEMAALTESIRENGILNPILVRPAKGGGYEILAGHRRTCAARQLGMKEVPALVRELDDDAATILMVDSNLQREKILPSEKAAAYKLRMEAMKRQAGRPKNSAQIERNSENKESRAQLSEQTGESSGQIQRYIRLTYQNRALLDAVDSGEIPMNSGVALSYLTEAEQALVLNAYKTGTLKLTLAKANELKDASRLGTLETMLKVETAPDVSREKKARPVEIRMSPETYRKFFGERKPREVMPVIEQALTEFFEKYK
ncbi:MAG: ParB/RepB/Spo0J family partition protein [Clostridia bacterium]|nr:ParB/RepB/Spo0J family partition protein [Clostridia bacterium]